MLAARRQPAMLAARHAGSPPALAGLGLAGPTGPQASKCVATGPWPRLLTDFRLVHARLAH
jgi:hypothetical protein